MWSNHIVPSGLLEISPREFMYIIIDKRYCFKIFGILKLNTNEIKTKNSKNSDKKIIFMFLLSFLTLNN